ncbi:MAG TPA: hypothetical protein VD859_01905 [Nocardioides sp.]|nr:hypothetical protein [Nocardioides sp.]
MRRRLFIVGGVVIVLVITAVVVLVWRSGDGDADSRLAAAVALAPEDSERFGWTDWSAVREELGSDVSADSSTRDVEALLTDGFDADLTSASALLQSAEVLQEEYGVSPASLDWELFAQGPSGAVVLMGLPAPLDLGALEQRLTDLGYSEPEEEGGVWLGGSDVLASIDGVVTPELEFVAIDAEERVLVASDQEEPLTDWRDAQRGSDVSDGVSDVVAAVGGAISASVYTGDHACAALAMSQAGSVDRAAGAELIEEAGEVSPLRGFAIAALSGGGARVAMAFETEEQARTNADARSTLASGPAPGQGGSFSDRFELGEVVADGEVVTMELTPRPNAFVVSDLAHGPVLFATC